MTAAHLNEHGAGAVKVMLVTPEEEPLELFGPAATDAVRSLLKARRITVRSSSLPAVARGRVLLLAGGAEVFADRVITLPVLEGPRLSGSPTTSTASFRSISSDGSATPSTSLPRATSPRPLKQGGLAAQQADAVAGAIAALAGAAVTPEPFRPVLRGLLLTGGAPLYLRAEPQRLAREATVAIEAPWAHRPSRDASAAAGQALWWPPAKIAGRYLAP